MVDIITLLAPCCTRKNGATDQDFFCFSARTHALTALFLGTLAGIALAGAAYFSFQTSMRWTCLVGGSCGLGGSLIFYVAIRCLDRFCSVACTYDPVLEEVERDFPNGGNGVPPSVSYVRYGPPTYGPPARVFRDPYAHLKDPQGVFL